MKNLFFAIQVLALTLHSNVWDAFVLSLDTVATLGSIPLPDDTGAEIVKVLLLVLGAGTLGYALITTTEFFVAGHVTGLLDARKRQQMVDGISQHYLVCGYGRVGRQVVRDLRAAGASYVVIDRNAQSLERAEAVGVPWLQGDASDEELFYSSFHEMIELVRARGTRLDDDSLHESALILPPPDLTLPEAEAQFTGEGLLPD